MLYEHGIIITVDKTRRIIYDGAILVRDDKIADIGKTMVLSEKYPDESRYDLSQHIVMPGMVSTHMHCVQSILRGIAEDRDLVSWMCDRIWVAQGNITGPEAYAAARMSIAEMLKGGTTCFIESLWAERYGFENLVRAVDESGIRGCLGKVIMDVNPDQPAFRTRMHHGLVEDGSSLDNAVSMFDRWHGTSDGRVQVWFGARTPGGVTSGLYKKMTKIAQEKGIRITMHCLEEKEDRDTFTEMKKEPMEYCQEMGILGPGTVLIHMVWPSDDDISRLSKTGTHIAHCPSSNLKLGSGFAPIPKYLEAGVNVGIGCDGAPCRYAIRNFSSYP
jgi:cytosine/adenosine deaminase-related metal-dependent hydrolase